MCSSCGGTRNISEYWKHDSICKICREETRYRKECSAWGTYEMKARLLGLIYKPIWFQDAPYEYHLDHVFSLYRGFQLSVPLSIICNRGNLQMIDSITNKRKGQSCWITLQQLYEWQQPMDSTYETIVGMVEPQDHTTIKRWIRRYCAERKERNRQKMREEYGGA